MSADSWIYSTLAADNTIKNAVGARIYQDLAPEGMTYPFIVFNLVDVMPEENAYADLIMDAEHWDIRVIDKGYSYTTAATIAAAIRSALHKKSSVTSSIVASRFVQSRRISEHDETGSYKTISQEFLIFKQ